MVVNDVGLIGQVAGDKKVLSGTIADMIPLAVNMTKQAHSRPSRIIECQNFTGTRTGMMENTVEKRQKISTLKILYEDFGQNSSFLQGGT